MQYLTPKFNSPVGVRQRNVLSPIMLGKEMFLSPNLFKIFINDLPYIFKLCPDAVILNGRIIDCLMYVLQCPSLHDNRRRLLDSTYLTRVYVLKFANLFQSRNKIKLRHLCKFIKIIFSKARPPG